MIRRIKEKPKKSWLWSLAKWKVLVLLLGIIGTALAAEGSRMFPEAPINYPYGVNTPAEIVEYCYKAQETLRLYHNQIGKQFREGKITEEEWIKFEEDYFEPRSDALVNEILKYREEVMEDEIGQKIIGIFDDTKAEEWGSIKEGFKKSTKYDVNLDTLLNQ